MRDYFRTKTLSVPIPTEPELYITMALVIMFAMWVVMR